MAQFYARPEDATAFGRALFMAHGLPETDAQMVADCLVRADLRGVDTHGLQYVSQYIGRIRAGMINVTPDLKLDAKTPVAGLLDAQNAFGFVAATRAMDEAIKMASTYGLGMVGVKRSTHFGMAACYVLQAVEAGYMALVFTNASRAMPPWGGREALLGTSPFAAGAPGGYVLDMSPAVAARGKIRRAARRGEQVPEGYGLDKNGRNTTDPAAILDDGVVLPIGGPKGSAIAMLMDIFGGVFTGAAYAGDVRNQFIDYDEPQNVGHFFLALKPDLFVSSDEFNKRMGVLVDRVHAVPAAEGFNEILMPGELEQRLETERRSKGIPYNEVELNNMQKEAADAGLPPLSVSDKPLA